MNDPYDPLEAELSALKPHAPSSALKQRIARDLEASQLAPVRSRPTRAWWIGAFTGGLIAASLAAGLLLRSTSLGKPESDSPLPPLQLPVAAAFDDALPTVWTYRRALAGPPQVLEALFDKHGALAPPRGGSTPAYLFIQSDVKLLFNGEL